MKIKGKRGRRKGKKRQNNQNSDLIQLHIRDVVRNKILYDWTKYTQEGQESKGVDWRIFCQAIDRLSMYSMVENKVFDYRDLGIQSIYGGALPSYIIREHQQIGLFYQEAYKEKERLNRH